MGNPEKKTDEAPGTSDAEAQDRARLARERREAEQRRRLEDLQAHMAEAQALREKREKERLQRLTEQRAKDQLRRQQVEERRRAITVNEELLREELRQREKERDERIGHLRASRTPPPPSEYAFGSSLPRLLESVDTSGFAWAARRAASTSNVNAASAPLRRRASSSQLYTEDKDDPLLPQPFVRSTVARRRTDLVPTIVVRSPGRAYSMTRLDRITAPRPLRHSASPSLHQLNKTQSRGHRSGDSSPASRPVSAMSSAEFFIRAHVVASSLGRSQSLNDPARARLRSAHETHRAGTGAAAASQGAQDAPCPDPPRPRPRSLYDKLGSANIKPPLPPKPTTDMIRAARGSSNKNPQKCDTSTSPSTRNTLQLPTADTCASVEAQTNQEPEPSPPEIKASVEVQAQQEPEPSPAEIKVVVPELPPPPPPQFSCRYCKNSTRVFDTSHALRVHVGKMHRDVHPTSPEAQRRNGSSPTPPLASVEVQAQQEPEPSPAEIKGRITTEEEAKAALAERRRKAREELERLAEMEKQRIQEEAESQRRGEEERLLLAIEARQEQERIEAIRKVREEAEKQARFKEEELKRQAAWELELKRKEDAERREKERRVRKLRVEAILARTRTKKADEDNKTTQEQAAVSAAAPLQTINGNNSDENLTSGLQNNIISQQIREPERSNGNVLVQSNTLRWPSTSGHVASAGIVTSFDLLDEDEV